MQTNLTRNQAGAGSRGPYGQEERRQRSSKRSITRGQGAGRSEEVVAVSPASAMLGLVKSSVVFEHRFSALLRPENHFVYDIGSMDDRQEVCQYPCVVFLSGVLQTYWTCGCAHDTNVCRMRSHRRVSAEEPYCVSDITRDVTMARCYEWSAVRRFAYVIEFAGQ